MQIVFGLQRAAEERVMSVEDQVLLLELLFVQLATHLDSEMLSLITL